jgi:hypothetical protein
MLRVWPADRNKVSEQIMRQPCSLVAYYAYSEKERGLYEPKAISKRDVATLTVKVLNQRTNTRNTASRNTSKDGADSYIVLSA